MIAWLALMISLAPVHTDSPVQAAYAYSRATTPGIPAGGPVAASPERAIATTYFIYIVVPKGCAPVVPGVWVKGTYYGAAIEQVPSPVTLDRNPAVPTGKRETLVPATDSAVYQVSPTDVKPWTPANDAERELIRDNELVVFVEAGGARSYALVKTIKRLPPVPGA